MNQETTSGEATPATPRPAATILLLRDGPGGLEVFMVVRHHAIDFASGALVFPGGRVDDADHDFASRLGTHARTGHADAFRVAAIRETFEECGVLLARPAGALSLVGADTLRNVSARHRSALNAGTTGFEAILRQEKLEPATDTLVHFAHWITPANQPKRYDTQFFLAAAPPEHLAVHDGSEAVDSVWINPARALADTLAGRFKLVFATAKNLEKLSRWNSVADALAAARATAVVTVQPHPTKLEDGRRLLRIPAEADYGGTEFIVDLPPAS
ncbi:NUDIX hydrolase [Rhodopila sp.]|jgi:8-oxo-dGTP pyrophosphatase MutT (NUDIX family)|uniref:NUDIX hydrolase n=1 Tax=Rhodopila sp. TaxID=2480087 RepID=UPI002C11CC9C|nr:NUDIX domain-containing protein [Rhodopila sp.]HVZ10189.1 NUDIX domain-containing protein [Rhodopila sp.]